MHYVDTAVAVLVIGGAVYSLVLLLTLGICHSGALEDEEHLRLLEDDEVAS